MADKVNLVKLTDGPKHSVIQVTYVEDNTTATNVRIDLDTLWDQDIPSKPKPPTKLTICQLWANVSGMEIDLYWENDLGNEFFLTLPSDTATHQDFRCFGGLGYATHQVNGVVEPVIAGMTGDIIITPRGMTAADKYSLIFEFKKD